MIRIHVMLISSILAIQHNLIASSFQEKYPALQNQQEVVLELYRSKGSLIRNLGGYTNKNYLIQEKNGKPMVIKFHNDLVKDRWSKVKEEKNQTKAFRLGIAPPIYSINQNASKIEYINPIRELQNDETDLSSCLSIICKLHNSSIHFEGNFDNLKDFIKYTNNLLSLQVFKSDKSDFEKFITKALRELKMIILKVPQISIVPTHGDLHLDNFVLGENGLMLIDWETSGMNDAAWDLSYFFLETIGKDDLREKLFKKYKQECKFIDPEFEMRVKLYRPFILIIIGLSMEFAMQKEEKINDEPRHLINRCFEGSRQIFNSPGYQKLLEEYKSEGN